MVIKVPDFHTKANKKINSIQILRAFAVILVIYNHSMIICQDNKFSASRQISFYDLQNWGSIGLDLFFVISGLIMSIICTAYIKKPGGGLNFIIKRSIRIVPLYWILSAIVYLERTLIHHPVSWGEITKTIIFLPVFAAKNVVYPIIGQGWSLSYEIYFYTLIALLISIHISKLYRNLLSTLLVFSVAGYFFNPNGVLLKFLFSPFLLEFALGIMIGRVYNFLISNYKKEEFARFKTLSVTLCFLGAIAMLSLIFIHISNIYNPKYIIDNDKLTLYRSLLWGVPCALLISGLVFSELSFNFTLPGFFVKIGDASYSGYLIHYLIIVIIGKIFVALSLNNGDSFIIVSTIISVLVSLPIYQYLEKPLIDWGNKIVFKTNAV